MLLHLPELTSLGLDGSGGVADLLPARLGVDGLRLVGEAGNSGSNRRHGRLEAFERPLDIALALIRSFTGSAAMELAYRLRVLDSRARLAD